MWQDGLQETRQRTHYTLMVPFLIPVQTSDNVEFDKIWALGLCKQGEFLQFS